MSSELETLHRDTERPFYQQIKDTILHKIKSGAWKPGEKIPSEHTLVSELGVSRMTVNRALRELTQQGRLKRVHGVGTFVAEPAAHASLIELKNIADEIRAQGKVHRTESKLIESTRAGAAVGALMGLARDQAVFHALIIHYQDNVPIQLEDRFVNQEMAPEFLGVDFTVTTPTHYLMSLFRPDEIEHTVKAVLPDVDECSALAIDRTEPCLRLQRRTWKGGVVVTAVSLLYPSSRYDLVARYTTDRTENIEED